MQVVRIQHGVAASVHVCFAASKFMGQLGPICAGRTVVIGDTVRLAITESCPRCVMITLPQVDLPKYSGILRTAAQHNGVNVGVYASVVNGGTIRSVMRSCLPELGLTCHPFSRSAISGLPERRGLPKISCPQKLSVKVP